jgi:hypothetical protein
MRFFVHNSHELNAKAEWLGWPNCALVSPQRSQSGWTVTVPGNRALLGGDDSCDLTLPGMMAQPHHCYAERTPSGRLFVEALSGYLIVNYRAVGRALLSPEDILYIGRAKVELAPPLRRAEAKRAAHPDTSPDELLSLAAEFPGEVIGNPALSLLLLEDPTWPSRLSPSALCQVLQHEDAPASFWSYAAHHERPLYRSYAARSQWAPPELLQHLTNDAEPRVRAYVAKNPSAPPALLSMLSRDTFPDTRANVARNPSAPVAALLELASDSSDALRACAALNTSLPLELLFTLADDDAELVRRGVVRNPCVPFALLEYLLSDPDGVVQWHAANRLRSGTRPAVARNVDDEPTATLEEEDD